MCFTKAKLKAIDKCNFLFLSQFPITEIFKFKKIKQFLHNFSKSFSKIFISIHQISK